MTQEQLEYAQWMRLRRQTLYRLKHLQDIKAAKIAKIRDFIKAGGDPTKDPDIRDDFFALMTESKTYFSDLIVLEDSTVENV